MLDKHRQKDWVTDFLALMAQAEAATRGERKVKNRYKISTEEMVAAFNDWGIFNTTLSKCLFGIDRWTDTSSKDWRLSYAMPSNKGLGIVLFRGGVE